MKQLSSPHRAAALALLVTIAAFAIALPVSAQDSTATEIDSCTTITESGEYVLTDDIENSDAETCISIEVSDVVLDGNGYTIDGTDAEGTTGVRAQFVDDVTVRDVTVTDWTSGVEYQSDADDGTVREVVAESNLVGISVNDASKITIADSRAVNNEGIGVSFFVSNANTVTDTVASDNGGPGFSFDDSSTNTVRNATARNNDGAGFVFNEGGQNTVTDVVATGNQQGFDLYLAGNTTIEEARVTNNTGAAFESDDVLGQDPETNTARHFEIDSATISFTEIKDTSEFNHALTVDAVASTPDDPDGLRNIGQYVNITESTANATPSVELDVQYDDADLEDAGVAEESLRLYTYADGEWTEVPNSSVDTEANTVSGTVSDIDDETLAVAPLGQPADEQSDNGTNDDEQTHDDSDNGDDVSNGDENQGSDDGTLVDVGAKDIMLDFGEIVIADFELNGPGIPHTHIDHRTYSVGDFDVVVDGLSFTIDDTDYRVGHISIEVEPFDVVLENVTLGNGE